MFSPDVSFQYLRLIFTIRMRKIASNIFRRNECNDKEAARSGILENLNTPLLRAQVLSALTYLGSCLDSVGFSTWFLHWLRNTNCCTSVTRWLCRPGVWELAVTLTLHPSSPTHTLSSSTKVLDRRIKYLTSSPLLWKKPTPAAYIGG